MIRRASWVPFSALILLLNSLAQAQDRPILAVFDIEDRGAGLKKKTLEGLTILLEAKLIEVGYQVIPRDQLRARLLDQKKNTYRECVEQSCQIELGKEVAAQKILSTNVMPMAGACQLTATLWDLKKAVSDVAASERADCNEEALSGIMPVMARKLAQPLSTQKTSSDKAMLEFDQLLETTASQQAARERVERAWQSVKSMASNESLALSTRAQLLQKFLETFPRDNPYQKPAEELLARILPGRLVVESTPQGVPVSINNSLQGQAPIYRELPAGRYLVKGSQPGFSDDVKDVIVSPGLETRVTLFLVDRRPARLGVLSLPDGAQVTIRSLSSNKIVFQGVAPLVQELVAGEYALELSKEGYQPEQKSVSLVAGKEESVRIPLTEVPPGTLTIHTVPEGAKVSIGNQPKGQSPVKVALRQGTYEVAVQMEGFETAVDQAAVQNNQTQELSLKLRRVLPMHPLKKWGHVSFWTGAGLAALGGVAGGMVASARSDYQAGDFAAESRINTWTGVMIGSLAAGGAAMVTGAVLWWLAPSKDAWRQTYEYQFAPMLPQPGEKASLGLSFHGRW